MIRSLSFLTLAVLAIGCTRYSTNPPSGPFARNKPKPNPDTFAPIPPGPLANTSPLVLAAPIKPEATATDPYAVVPPRQPEPVVPASNVRGQEPGEIIPASAIGLNAAAAVPPLLPRRSRGPEPQPNQMPSPFAPKEPPANQPPAARNIAEIKKLAEAAADKWAKVDTYEATVTRHELAPNKDMTEDVVLYQFRKEPMAVYIKNISEAGKGREIIYYPAKHGDKIYAVIGKGDENFLYKVGQKAPAVSPDMPLVKTRTRYSIREAGHGTPIARVAGWAAKAEAGKIPAENLTYLGEVNRPEFKKAVVGVQLKLRRRRGAHAQWRHAPVVLRYRPRFAIVRLARAHHRHRAEREGSRVLPFREGETEREVHRRGLRPRAARKEISSSPQRHKAHHKGHEEIRS